MFFPEKIKSIKNGDKVLEIGPGGTPHPRSDVFLEKIFENENEKEGQRGYAPKLETSKQIFYYKGGAFPFASKEFDYVICSHVLEHVEDVDSFTKEITRVGKRGYIEFPTIYYDYIYNFPEHLTFLLWKNNKISWIPKEGSDLKNFQVIHDFFYLSLIKGYSSLVNDLKEYFFQGFEWDKFLFTEKVNDISDVVYEKNELRDFMKSKMI